MFSMKCVKTLIITFSILLTTSYVGAYQARVIGITDGDSITVLHEGKQVKLRLHGIDCPELHQDFGRAAKKFTSDQAFGKVADIEALGKDRYYRTVALVTIEGSSLNESLLKNGLAWVYPKYYKEGDWYQLEEQAQKSKLGLWSDPRPTPPWDFRKDKPHTDEN